MDRDQLKHLFDKYFEELRSYLYYRSGDEALSTDLAQETFVKIWEKQLIPLPGKEKGLLYKIAGDLFVSSHRRKQSEFKFREQFTFDADDITPEELMEYQELESAYRNALEELKEEQRVVFLMNRSDGLTYREISARLNISVKAVEKRMQNALKHFRKAIQ